jgi:hypothetical protein
MLFGSYGICGEKNAIVIITAAEYSSLGGY